MVCYDDTVQTATIAHFQDILYNLQYFDVLNRTSYSKENYMESVVWVTGVRKGDTFAQPVSMVWYRERYAELRWDNECLVHSGDGYRKVQLDKRQVQWHRLVYAIENNALLLSDSVIRHKCDNPRCSNPAHLEEGGTADNVHDAIYRGRMKDTLCPLSVAYLLELQAYGMSDANLVRYAAVPLNVLHEYLKGIRPKARNEQFHQEVQELRDGIHSKG